MSNVRTQDPNAPLTTEGRRRMVACVLEQYWTIEATADRFQVDAKTVRKWRDTHVGHYSGSSDILRTTREFDALPVLPFTTMRT